MMGEVGTTGAFHGSCTNTVHALPAEVTGPDAEGRHRSLMFRDLPSKTALQPTPSCHKPQPHAHCLLGTCLPHFGDRGTAQG